MPRRKTARPFEKEIGKRLQLVRKSQSLSQDAIATFIGSAKGHISNIEAGLVAMTFETMVRLARQLNISMDALAEGIDTAPHRGRQDGEPTQRIPRGESSVSCPMTTRSAQ